MLMGDIKVQSCVKIKEREKRGVGGGEVEFNERDHRIALV
jgi:hypothetical protein